MKGSARTGRRPGTRRSREKILSSARVEFAARGYGGTTIARVARRAGCDPALVHHFFGTKEKLFDEAMELPVKMSEQMPPVLSDPDRIGEHVARLLLESWESGRGRQVLLGLLRSALSSDSAARRVRDLIVQQAIAPTLGALDVPDADVRASLVGAHLVGLMVARHIARIEPLASMSTEDVVLAVGPALEYYLTGEIAHSAGGGA